jgi:thiol-disulfide isomerase/thioredoxin
MTRSGPGPARRAPLLWAALMLLVGACLLGLMTLPIGPSESAGAIGSLVGLAAPALQAEDLGGRSWTLSDARGRFVWINYWATWCPPCRTEMPMMQRLHERYGDQLLIIGVNFGEDEASVADFVERYGISYPILLDPALENFYRWSAVFGLPMHYFVTPDGRVVRAFTGELPPEAMLETVDALLEQSVPLGLTLPTAAQECADAPATAGGGAQRHTTNRWHRPSATASVTGPTHSTGTAAVSSALPP